MTTDEPVIVTGIKPTGRVHLGNYLGMIRPTFALAVVHDAYIFVADGHAMTTERDPKVLASRSREAAASLLALGLDPEHSTLYRQSSIPEVFELAWFLACSTPKGLLNRAHAYKAATESNLEAGRPPDDGITTGLFTYPVLMAADILAVGANAVPVGTDQSQHVEFTREVGRAFNRDFGPVFTIPTAIVDADVGVIRGTDGRKMSKSYGNVLPIFAEDDEMARLIRGIVTDSRAKQDPKDPDASVLFGLYRHLADPPAVQRMAERYRLGGLGYGEVKDELIDLIHVTFAQAREQYHTLLAEPSYLEAKLREGAERVQARAAAVLNSARRVRGLAT